MERDQSPFKVTFDQDSGLDSYGVLGPYTIVMEKRAYKEPTIKIGGLDVPYLRIAEATLPVLLLAAGKALDKQWLTRLGQAAGAAAAADLGLKSFRLINAKIHERTDR